MLRRAFPHLLILAVTLPLSLRLWLGMGLGLFITPVVVFIVIPILDRLLGVNTQQPPNEAEHALSFRIVLYLMLPAQAALTLLGIRRFAAGTLSVLGLVDVLLSVGLVSGALGITVAHELVHRKHRFERGLGFFLLWLLNYMHWGLEHVHGHHRWVATPQDPASAPRGMSVYRFIPRALLGEWRSAWAFEKKRLWRKGHRTWSWRNRMLGFAFAQVLLGAAVFLTWGTSGLLGWLGFGFIAAVVLQIINYLEHYGIQRREIAPGIYERVTPRHSWDASFRLTNWLLFNLQRHADHHAHAARPYPALRHTIESPKLPAGYASILLLPLLPPLWFRVMHPRLDNPQTSV